MTYHENARTTKIQRKMIKESKEPYRVLAKQMGVSKTTIAKWKSRENMNDLSSKPKNIQKALPDTVEPLLDFLRRDWMLDMNTIWFALKSTLFPQITKSAVYRQLVRQGINNIKELRPGKDKTFGKFEACNPGFIHIDVFYLPKINNIKLYVFIAIDRATRMLTLRAYPDREAQSAVDFLKHCKNFYPFKITKILTDNGGEFTNKSYKKNSSVKRPRVHLFQKACEDSNIYHALTKACHPWTNGLAERTVGSIKNETIYRFHFESVDQMISALYGFERFFNCHRPYKAMGCKTPEELCNNWRSKEPNIFDKEPVYCSTTL
jgi:transposase InsO family protein